LSIYAQKKERKKKKKKKCTLVGEKKNRP
jgi:hypothetical protein